jgi:5-hydroxyisourate hydrolase-like protein (transthyretin family)
LASSPAQPRRIRVLVVALVATLAVLSSTLTSLAARADETRSISGVVQLPAGVPADWLKGVYAAATPNEPGGAGGSAAVDPVTGAYRVENLAPGSYRVQFQANAYWDGNTSVRPNLVPEYYDDATDYLSATLVDVSASDAEGVDAALAEGRSISGRVTIPAGFDQRALGAVGVSVSGAGGVGGYGYGYTMVDPETGDYMVTGLAPGAYRVQFQVNTYWGENGPVRPNLVSEYYDDALDYMSATPVDITAGSAEGIDADLIEGRSITGTIAIPDDVDPEWIRGVSVLASSVTGSVTASGSVDPATGAYSVPGLAPGAYRLQFNVSTYFDGNAQVEPNLVPEYYDNAFSPAGATPVDVTAEDRTGVDAALERGTSISGTVTLPAGAPTEWLEGIGVAAVGPDGASLGNTWTRVDPATGAYRIDRLPPGEHRVAFTPSGGNLLSPEYYDDATILDQAEPVSTADGDATGIDAQLDLGARIDGSIDVSALRAAAGSEVGYGVYLTDETGTTEVSGYGDPLFQDEVPLNMGVVRPGTYRIAIVTSTWDETTNTSTPQSAQFLRFGQAGSITLEAGDEITDLHLTARATDATLSGTLTAEGFDPDPVDGILGSTLFYERIDGDWVRLPGTRFDTDRNGTTAFTLAVPSGTYTAGYEDDYSTAGIDIAEQWWNNKTSLAAATPVLLADGAHTVGIDGSIRPVDAQPQPTTRSISGHVTLPEGSDPRALEAVWVSAYPTSQGGAPGMASVDPVTGAYELADLEPGSYRVQFNVNSYWDGNQSVRPNLVPEYYDDVTDFMSATLVDVSVTNADEVDAALAEGRSISGRVTLPEGFDQRALGAIGVSASSFSGAGGYGYAMVDPETGDYTVTGLAPGAYRVQFQVNTYWDGDDSVRPNLVSEYFDNATDWSLATPVDVSTENKSGVNASLEEGRSITGTVTLPAEAPADWLRSISVSASAANGTMIGSVSAAPDPQTGEYSISGLAPGAYHVAFRVTNAGAPGAELPNLVDEYHDGAYTQASAAPVDVTDADRHGIDATLESGRSISGVVSLPADAPPSWKGAVSVSIFTRSGESLANASSVRVDPATGAYTYPRLPADDFLVYFSAAGYWDGSAWASTDIASEYYDDARTREDATLVSTRGGSATRIDAELERGGGIDMDLDVAALLGTGSGIGVSLTDADGRVVAAYGDGLQEGLEYPLRFANLYPGRYRIAVTTSTWDEQTGTASLVSTQFLRFGSEAGVEVTAGNTVTGQVSTRSTDASISGKLRAEGFTTTGGVLGSILTYERLDGSWVRLPDVRFDATANGDTAYSLRVPAGTYTVGYETDFSTAGGDVAEQWWKGKSSLAAADAVDVGHGQTRSGIDGGLHPADWQSEPEPTSPFADVPKDHPFFREISWLATAGISRGWDTGNGQWVFLPNEPVGRDAVAAFLYRHAGSPAFTAPATSPFIDVPLDNPFYKEITWLAHEEITNGWDLGDGSRAFRPKDQIGRDAVAAFLYRYAGSPRYSPPTSPLFVDVPLDNPFYKEISWLAENGISKGWDIGGGRSAYQPKQQIARDAVAVFLFRYDRLD